MLKTFAIDLPEAERNQYIIQQLKAGVPLKACTKCGTKWPHNGNFFETIQDKPTKRCRLCKRAQNKIFSHKARSTKEGRIKTNTASNIYRSTEKGHAKSCIIRDKYRKQNVSRDPYDGTDKHCSKCNETKLRIPKNWSPATSSPDGLHGWCLSCLRKASRSWRKNNPDKHTALTQKRNAAKLRATPSYANEAAIEQIYKISADMKAIASIECEVDHEFPLRGKFGTGLHHQDNLRILTKEQHKRKGNKWPWHIPHNNSGGYLLYHAPELRAIVNYL